jgi:hypothetical protein
VTKCCASELVLTTNTEGCPRLWYEKMTGRQTSNCISGTLNYWLR